MASASEPFTLGKHQVPPGERLRIKLKVARLPTDTWLSLPVEVVHGAVPGPALWLTGAVHGDEVNGVEIISRVIGMVEPSTLRGTLVAVPIVNVFGFIGQDRYLPDRRDLNRSFPGRTKGSLAARLAHLVTTEVVARCTHGIDLHSGSNHRTNLPQVRGNLDDPSTLALARAFGARAMIHAKSKKGTLRGAATEQGNEVLLFEGGEALRFDVDAIEAGTAGVLRVMKALGMIEEAPAPTPEPQMIRRRHWLRARRGGILHLSVELGDRIEAEQALGVIHDTFGAVVATVHAREPGMVIGLSRNPLVHQGDALVHVGVEDDAS